MELSSQPLVSVVTPVYNGDKFLAQCIESVFAQTYKNWEYIIVNNCSEDRSLEIAQGYAKKDPRLRVYNNKQFLPVIENSNHTLRQISVKSKYCKILHADDWLFPQCIELMVGIAEANPSCGLVGSYGLWGKRVVCDKLPYPTEFISGAELCRRTLLGEFYLFLSPTSLLIRSEIIRKRDDFYVGSGLHADIKAYYEILRDSDFCFVHQVLTFIRKHKDSQTSTVSAKFSRIILSNLDLLIKYGPVYLSSREYKSRLKEKISEYYSFLAKSLFQFREKEFWNYHKKTLTEIGHPFSIAKLTKASLFQLIKRPKASLELILGATRKS